MTREAMKNTAAGTIAGAIHIEYIWNNYANDEYKIRPEIFRAHTSVRISYPEMKIILFCKTSVQSHTDLCGT